MLKQLQKFKLFTDLFALSGGQLLSMLIGFLSFAFLARVLGPLAYGKLEYAVGLSVIFTTIISWGLSPIGIRKINHSPESVTAMAALIPTTRLAITLLAIPVMIYCAVLAGQEHEIIQLVILFSLTLLAIPWKQDWLLQGLEMMSAAAIAQPLRATAFAIGVVIFVRSSEDLLQVGMIEIFAAALSVLYFLVMQQLFVTPVRFRIELAEIRRLIVEGISLGLTNIVWAISQYLPLILIASMIGGNDTAWFGSSHRIVFSLLTLSALYYFNLYPAITRLAAQEPEELHELLTISFRVIAWAGIGSALLLALLSRPIMALAFGNEFAAADTTLAIMVWALPVTLLSGHARWTLIAMGEDRYVLLAQVIGAVTVFVMSLVLIPKLESMGAAIAFFIASLGVWATSHICGKRRIGYLPKLSIVALPVLLAGAGYILAMVITTDPWTRAALAVGVYFLVAPFIDGKLVPAIKRLAHAKNELGLSTGTET